MPDASPAHDPDLPLLVAFVTHGDRDALARLLTNLAPAALALARRRMGNAADAEDAVQQACLDAIAGCRSFQAGRGSVRGWLLTIVLNRCRKAERSATRRDHHEAVARPPVPPAPPDPDVTQAVQDAVSELPEHERMPVELRFLAGLDFPEIAAALGRKEKTVRSQVDRALARLRELLQRRGIGPVEAGTIAGALALPPCEVPIRLTERLASLARRADVPPVAAGSTALLITAGVLAAGVVLATVTRLGSIPATSHPSPIAAPMAETPPQPSVATSNGLRLIGNAPFQAPGPILGMAFSTDSKRLAVGTMDQGIVVWDLPSGAVLSRLNIKGIIHDMFWRSPTQLVYLAQESSNHSVIVLDLITGRESRRIPLPTLNMPQMHPTDDGRWLVVSTGKNPLGSGRFDINDCGLALVDLDLGNCRVVSESVVRQEQDLNFSVAAGIRSPDGSRVAFIDCHSGWNGMASTHIHRPLRIGMVDAGSGLVLQTWDLPGTRDADGGHLRWTTAETIELQLPGEDRSPSTWTAKLGEAEAIKIDGCTLRDSSGRPIVFLTGNVLREAGAGSSGKALLTLPDGWQRGNVQISSDGRWVAIAGGNSSQPALADLTGRRWISPIGESLSGRPNFTAWSDDDRLLVSEATGMRIVDDVEPAWTCNDPPYVIGADCPAAGRLLLTPGGQSGKPIAWDLATHQRLGQVASESRTATENMYLSPTGRWAVHKGEYSAKAHFIDLESNSTTGQVIGKKHPFFKGQLQLMQVAWDRSEETAFIADTTAIWFSIEDRAKSGITGAIAISGAWDPATGTQRFCFRNAQGTPIEAVAALALSPDGKQVFLRTGSWEAATGINTTAMTGLWSATDGTIQRIFPDPGANAGFTPDGALVVGASAAVSVTDGKNQARYPVVPDGLVSPSPSHTWIAVVRPGLRIELLDARTGASRWSTTIADPAIAEAKPNAVSWSRGEHRLAIRFADKTCVARVDLFPAAPPARDLKAAATLVNARDPIAAHDAALSLIAAGAPAVAALTPPRSPLAVLVLEQLARSNTVGATEALAQAAIAGEVTAQDSRARLAIEAAAKARAAMPPRFATKHQGAPVVPGSVAEPRANGF